MDAALRRAWTQIVTAEDYEEHMAAIGQAQAAADMTRAFVELASLRKDAHIIMVGAGAGQIFDLVPAEFFRQYRLTCTDLNPTFLAHLKERSTRCGLAVSAVVDDFEQTALTAGADLIIATLLLEHIDWQRGAQVFAALRPKACVVILQENPPGMATAITPGRQLPPSLAEATQSAHPTLVSRDQFIADMAERGLNLQRTLVREVADGKRLVGLFFGSTAPICP